MKIPVHSPTKQPIIKYRWEGPVFKFFRLQVGNTAFVESAVLKES